MKHELGIREADTGVQGDRAIPSNPTSQFAVGDKAVGALVGENQQETHNLSDEQPRGADSKDTGLGTKPDGIVYGQAGAVFGMFRAWVGSGSRGNG